MTRLRDMAAAALFVLISLTTTSQADIRFGVAAEPYPPFTTKDASGSWVGWEIDFMTALCAAMNEKCELVETAWDGIVPALQGGKIDVVLASMAITAKRKEQIAFSSFYYNSSVGMIANKDTLNAISAEALTGKVIGVQTATISAAYVDKHFATVAKRNQCSRGVSEKRCRCRVLHGLGPRSARSGNPRRRRWPWFAQGRHGS
jgi:polar amino acid transport system substrate-binding protein